MKIAILYDSMFGNTKQLAEFLAEEIQDGNHQIQLFRTKETKPGELLAFQPMAILVGGPTHIGNPARTLGKYIQNLGKLGKEAGIHKAAVFNCNNGTDVCKKIEQKLIKTFPKLALFEKTLPIKTGGQKGPLPDNWKEDASAFTSAFLAFIS
jgi:flavodoxin